MSFADDLALVCANNLRPDAMRTLRAAAPAGLAEWPANDLRRWAADLLGSRDAARIRWPRKVSIEAQSARLIDARARILWRGDPGWFRSIEAELPESEIPPYLILIGPARRLLAAQIAIIGSRETPPHLLDAARRLGRALSDAGLAVTSGLARGADWAGHEGAAQGCAGTIAIPARGVLGAFGSLPPPMAAGTTLLGIAPPRAEFSTGLAIRRNHLIAALARGLVLVASDIHGGSSYALRWALAQGRSVWCFQCGAATPRANAALIRSRVAAPLRLSDAPEKWIEQIQERLSASAPARRRPARVSQPALIA